MATSLAEIRAKLQAQENRQAGGQSQGDQAIYPHWSIEEFVSYQTQTQRMISFGLND